MDAADYAEAENILENLIVTEPDYAWPRSLLYDLCRMRKDNGRCLSLTRDLVRLEPFNAVYAGMFAESLTNAGKTGEALTAVRRALEIDPAYGYASNRLFNSLLEAGDLVGATQLAALMERFQKGPRSQLAQARLAIAENRMDDALRYAEALTGTDEEGAEWALDALRSFWPDVLGSHIDRLGRMVSSLVREGRAKNPGVCEIWVKLRRPTEVVRDVQEALTLPVSEELRNAIVHRLLCQASDADAHECALKAVRKHGAALRGSTPLWGAVTYVMVRAEKHRKLLRWAADWRTREGREPWMISNIGYALLIEKGPLAAGEAWAQVLEHGASSVWDQAAAGMAFVNAVQGRPEEARRLIDNLRGQDINVTDKFSVAFAEAALGAAKAGSGRNRQNREKALGFFREANTAWPGGIKTKYGKHYLRELRSFLSKNKLDPTFGKPPDSKRYLDQGIPWWVAIPFVIAAIAGMRICRSSSNGKRNQPLNFPTTPEWNPHPSRGPKNLSKPDPLPDN
jgi:tetratricopeptide (TPR) repeat protein